jgi:hypothetical protein
MPANLALLLFTHYHRLRLVFSVSVGFFLSFSPYIPTDD